MIDASRDQLKYPIYKQRILEGVNYLEMLTDPLELWVEFAKFPEWAKVFPEAKLESKAGVFALGPLTRNTRLVINDDHLLVTSPEGEVINTPFDAIYCIAIRGQHQDLNWPIEHNVSKEHYITFIPFYYPVVE